MRWSGSSYNGEGRVRQSPPLIRPVAVVVLAAHLGGCAGFGLPFGKTGVDSNLTTGTIEKTSSKHKSKVEQSDWATIRKRIARAAAEDSLSQAHAWRNPETGTTGTLMVLDTVTATNDSNCRNFQTTVNDVRGIRHYRGEACKMAKDRWELFGVLADDSKLL